MCVRKGATRMMRVGPQVGAKSIGCIEREEREREKEKGREGGRLPTPSFKHTQRGLAPALASLEWRTINLHIAAVLINAAESS